MAEKQDKNLNPEQDGAAPEASKTENTPEAAPEAKAAKKAKPGKAKGEGAQLAAAEARAETAEAELEKTKEALLRTAAEYENYRKRSQREHDAAFNDGVSHAVVQLLPVLDTLEAAANAESSDPEYKKGVELTLKSAQEVFQKLGITEIEAMGQEFDPELCNAVMQQPAEGAATGTVTSVMQKGYRLGDRVVRHAMVAVAP